MAEVSNIWEMELKTPKDPEAGTETHSQEAVLSQGRTSPARGTGAPAAHLGVPAHLRGHLSGKQPLGGSSPCA